MSAEELYNDGTWTITLETAKLPDGRMKKASRVHRCDTVHILAFTDDQHVLLLREYRPFYGQYIWMLPSGRVDKETDPLVAAQRELQEEAGFKANDLKPYGTTRHSESFDSTNHIFIARDLDESSLPQDEDELIEVHTLTLEEAIEKVLTSPEVHTASAYALLRYLKDKTV